MKRGFSLVELSIVLVILGLLVGGILAGQSLIRASELRSVTSELARWQTATMAFRDKYFALPGDMTNAQAFWGVANATPSVCATTAATGTATCNGDGNGMVEVSPPSGVNESYRFWQHLSNAGLIEGRYSGITQGSTPWTSTKDNSPAGKISNSLWYITYWTSSFASIFDGTYGHSFEYGGANANSDPITGIMKAEELWNIDTKLDDGKPATGKQVVRGSGSNSISQCTDTAVSSNMAASYLLNSSNLGCVAIFRQQF